MSDVKVTGKPKREYPMETYAELKAFHDKIKKKRREIGISNDSAWYRGVSFGGSFDKHGKLLQEDPAKIYKLLPGLLRDEWFCSSELRKQFRIEKQLYVGFYTESQSGFPQKLSSWEVLAVMRHSGLPTRLLDWTDNLFAAIYFALCYGTNSQTADPNWSPGIWILNPYRLNDRELGTPHILGLETPFTFDYFDTILGGGSWPRALPISIAPYWATSRIRGQRGYFTAHGSNLRPMEITCRGSLEYIPISKSLVPLLLDELELAGIGHHTMFPDFDGIGRQMKERFYQPDHAVSQLLT